MLGEEVPEREDVDLEGLVRHVRGELRHLGIAPDVAESLFSVGVTSKPHGTGIGLAVARGLARQHGGELELANRARGGCVATLTLPAAPPVTTEAAE